MRAVAAIAYSAFVLCTWFPRAWAGRWIADDYCFAVSGVRDGFWRSQQLVYMNASGRFSVAFFYAVVTRLGREAAPYLAIAVMITWIILAWLAARRAFPTATRLEQFAAGLIFVGAIVAAAPDSYQPLIWTGGLATYGLPIVCMTALIALRNPIAIAPIAFFAGGCSEVAACAQILFSLAALPFFPRARRSLATIAIASAVALTIVAIAPGNFKRRALFHGMPLLDAAQTAIVDTPRMIGTIAIEGCVPLGILIALVAFFPRTRGTVAMLAAACAVVAVTLCGSLYGTGRLPWGRVQFVPVAYVALALTFIALPTKRFLTTTLTIAMIVLGALGVMTTSFEPIAEARAFASAADAVDKAARSAKGRDLSVRAPREFDFLEFLARDPNHWTNRCMAEYYGLKSISSR